MTTPRIEEMVGKLETSLEAKFNLVVRALIQNINGTITEGERMDICNKLNQDGINEVRTTLTEAHQAGIDEAVEKVLKVVKGMAWDANNETPNVIRILKYLHDYLSTLNSKK